MPGHCSGCLSLGPTARPSLSRRQGPLTSLGSPGGSSHVSKAIAGSSLHPAAPRWAETGSALSGLVSAARHAVGLPCSLSQTQAAPGLPVLWAEAIWWAWLLVLIFVPLFPPTRHPKPGFVGEYGWDRGAPGIVPHCRD